ncbi:uncharacterized protein METZ01_LOCUS249056, partial [marine metagenome]
NAQPKTLWTRPDILGRLGDLKDPPGSQMFGGDHEDDEHRAQPQPACRTWLTHKTLARGSSP